MTGLPAKSVRRREDVRLLTGGGNYASDGKAAGMTAAVLVRSPHAHANIARLDTAAAKAFLKSGSSAVPTDLDPAELAAWTDIARALLNLHETITRN